MRDTRFHAAESDCARRRPGRRPPDTKIPLKSGPKRPRQRGDPVIRPGRSRSRPRGRRQLRLRRPHRPARERRVGVHAALRRRPPVRGPSRRRLPRGREEPLRRRDRGVRSEPPSLRREHAGPRHDPPRPGRACARGHRLRAALLAVREALPPDGPRPDPAPARGAAPHPGPGPSPLRRRAPGRGGHPRVQPRPLRRLRPHRPAHHRRTARLRPRRILVLPRGADHPVPRPGREPDPPGGGDRGGLPERHHRLLAGMGPAPARAARMAGIGDPGRDHPQALLVRGDRRDHRRR